jgi:hypothetical protein
MRKQLCILTVTVIALLSIAALASCSQTFTVPALHETTIQLSLNQGDAVSGSIVVSGGVDNEINFLITDPLSNNVASYSRTTQTSFSFQAQSSGNYTLHFDNSFGLLARSVTLDYKITPSVAGLPQGTFVLIAAVAVVVLIVAAMVIFVLLRRSHH